MIRSSSTESLNGAAFLSKMLGILQGKRAPTPHAELIADVIRWEKVRRDAVRSQVIEVLEAQEIKETDNEGVVCLKQHKRGRTAKKITLDVAVGFHKCGWKGGDSNGSAEKKLCPTKQQRNRLAPTGLPMEGDFRTRRERNGDSSPVSESPTIREWTSRQGERVYGDQSAGN
jgi:hypothetical protein